MSKEDEYSTRAFFEKGGIALIYIIACFSGISENPLTQALCIGTLLVLFIYSCWRKFVIQSVFTGFGVLALVIILFT
jgi:hypothetical protein